MWIPFGMEKMEKETLVEDVPDYMLNSLVDWVCDAELLLCFNEDHFSFYDRMIIDEDERRSLVNEYDRKTRHDSMLYSAETRDYFLGYEEHRSILLSYIDFLILKLSELDSQDQVINSWLNTPYLPAMRKRAKEYFMELNSILDESGSIWKVGERRGYAGLERRVTGLMQDTAEILMNDDSTAAQFLSSAWRNVFGRTPNYSEAYADAIKAVEAVAASIVEPKNAKTTLSKLASVMRDQAGWHFAIEPRDVNNVPGGVVQLLMSAMMNGHSDRHGNGFVEAITKDKAEAAVFTAVFLIQAFKSGLVCNVNQ